MHSDVLIAGGGIGGLTAAVFLAERGLSVTVAEASNEWGGCAGKFRRGPYLFPAGATLGMGFEEGGIHELLLSKLGLSFPYAEPLDTVMGVHLPKGFLEFKTDRSAHLEGTAAAFPEAAENAEKIRAFYADVWKIGEEVKKMLGSLPVLPISNISDAFDLMKSLKPGTLSLLPSFTKTVGDLLRKHGLSADHPFTHFLDAQLIDSMQTGTEDCSAIMGAYALTIYHEGAFYVKGGLNQLAEKLAEAAGAFGAQLKKRTWIQSVSQDAGGMFQAVDQKGREWTANHFVSTLPLPNMFALLDDRLKRKIGSRYSKKSQIAQWGTMTLYLAIKEEVLPSHAPLFQQVLTDGHGSMAEGAHIFLSLSHAEDRLRAPEGYRTLNISTHTDLRLWDTKEKYDSYKQELREKMLAGVRQAIPRIEEGIVHEEIGAPKAWERFTKRSGGMVGGLPQTKEHALLRSLSHRTDVKNLWLCGDSIFPGAGTAGVSVSGYHVYRSIMKKMGRSYL
ncbi:FAD-dependent oxidoreductase [Bacillus mangrovi]|uniref:FAD-dependent oxidoreductase n=1 Tax=Metabacillus mangrovi TaxID=1491830 RepID=A0A7X2S4V9_9BACI|nr:FAD-dependent oxidoreductase [Metabacillus mangrovi]MTH53570.1 FAD-dependent oxidoreductase [Metabacillus mangrovi]